MSSSARSPAVTPLEDDDLLYEILLRLSPQPSSLPRASAVCKRWCLLVSDPGFFRRFCLHQILRSALPTYSGGPQLYSSWALLLAA
ncbi:hypothetical protein QYE76_055565 [Lolium multiflorum]|uniref:F-box domain-containing protein n=1 Tax=Lolium multiflorum TaxID=4521 RepID=A0AAD8WMF0_LOLMU|nr:hypothetical protein QYE76_055565 [Lolium multiflorum]